MILQSLLKLYQREPKILRAGFADMQISWIAVLSENGELIGMNSMLCKSERGNKTFPTLIPAPSVGKRTSGDKAIFLADKTDYFFGISDKTNTGKPKVSKNRFKLFQKLHFTAQKEINDWRFDAVCNFLNGWNPEDDENIKKIENLANADFNKIKGTNITFQITLEQQFVHDLEVCKKYWTNITSKEASDNMLCLLTNERKPVKIVHPAIKSVIDEPGKPSEKGLVVFQAQKTAFSSYGKDGKQGCNAPISIEAAFGYSNALNWLLANRERRFRLGDATTVFWTDSPTPAEQLMPWMISGNNPEDITTLGRVKNVLERLALGTIGPDELGDLETPYYILGISPNSSRLSIRFWHTSTLGDLIHKLRIHFVQLSIVRQWDETNSISPETLTPSANRLLLETTPLKKGRRDETKISSHLAGVFMNSILTGSLYPDALANGIMNRIRVVEKKPKGEGTIDNVNYLRAAILKAWIMRNHTEWLKQQNITMTTALEKDNPSVAYQLGRLFAVYEQAQRAAHEYKLERTIRETMFSSACSTPLVVFVRLDKLNKYHLQKLKRGSKNFLSDLIDEIHQKITASGAYPTALDLKNQSLFCIGYYHQRHDLRPKKQPPLSQIL
jgi:CRISPR-associated protein Csd1